MKHVRHFACRQSLLMGAVFTLVVAELAEPWQLLAEEAKLAKSAIPIEKLPEGMSMEVVFQLQHANAGDVASALRKKYQNIVHQRGDVAPDKNKDLSPKYKGSINVEAFAPRNSVVVSAPQEVLDDIRLEVASLDEQAGKAPDENERAVDKPAEQTWGNLKGRFIYDGPPPAPVKLNIKTDPEVYGKLNLVDESLIVAKDRSLANLVIWVRTKNVPIHNSYEGLKKLQCDLQVFKGRLEPHITPYWTGQPLRLRNLDLVAANINGAFVANAPFNSILPQRAAQQIRPLTEAEVTPVCVSDNIHAWLKGWMVIQPHPYVAISDAEGRFELKNLPAGVPLEFQVWQETSGWVQKAEIGGKDAGWAKGRFTLSLKPDETNDFGDIKLDPQQFNKGGPARAAVPFAGQIVDPLNRGLQRAVAAPAVAVLGKGEKLKLEAGKLTVKLPNVGQMLLEGPATVALVDDQRLKVSQGRIKLQITEAAGRGFVIETPHGQVDELGKGSSVSVEEGGKADVVIRDGKVEVIGAQKAEDQPANKKADPPPASDAQAPVQPNPANNEAAAPPARGLQPARETSTGRGGRGGPGGGFGGGFGSSNASGEESRVGRRRGGTTVEEQTQEREKLEKLLIGTWRGGHSDGLLVFREGGIFEESPQTLTGYVRENNKSAVQGRWSILPGSRPSLHIVVEENGASLRGLPEMSSNQRAVNTDRIDLHRLDDGFLRIYSNSYGVTLFFHRVEKGPERDKAAAKVPEGISRLAELAELTGQDATALAAPQIDWLKQWDVSDAQLALIEKVAKARRGEIDLAELFDLSKEDADAFAELYSMTKGNFKAIRELADKNQLTAAEHATVKKLASAKDEFERGIGAMKDGVAKVVRFDPETMPPIEPKTLKALGKLSTALDQLWNFPNATVFAEPPPDAPAGRRGGGFRAPQRGRAGLE